MNIQNNNYSVTDTKSTDTKSAENINSKKVLMKKLCAYAFAAYDWNLYLDTHPYDTDAIKMFRKMADTAEKLKQEFQTSYGPLEANASDNPEIWNWICDPWPWENHQGGMK